MDGYVQLMCLVPQATKDLCHDHAAKREITLKMALNQLILRGVKGFAEDEKAARAKSRAKKATRKPPSRLARAAADKLSQTAAELAVGSDVVATAVVAKTPRKPRTRAGE